MKDDVDGLHVKIELVMGISFIRDIDLDVSLVSANFPLPRLSSLKGCIHVCI